MPTARPCSSCVKCWNVAASTCTCGAPYRLVLTNEQERERSATYNSGNRTAEYELTTKLDYSILGLNNLELMSDKLEVRKVYVRDGSNITGSEQEAKRAREEMRRDLVNAMVVRLQMLSPPQLDELQRKADERAQAEAAALEAARRQQAETPQQSPLEVPGN